MGRGRRRRGLTAGTMLVLLLTLAVVLGCAGFLYAIAGGHAVSRATELLTSFSHGGAEQASPSPQPTGTPKPAAPLAAVAASPAPAATETPVPGKITLTIAAGGTVYAPKAIRQTVESGTGQADFEPVFAPLQSVFGAADLAIATLETTTAGSEKGYGNYNTPAQILDALRACGIDLLSLATERALDKGYEGLEITLQELTRCGLSYAGVSTQGGGAMATMERIGGVQVAVLAYTYGLSDEGSEKTSGDARGTVAMLELERMCSDIARARLDGANLVIVLPHWGTKNKEATPESVREMARALAEAGADLILGAHPNVVQGIERLTATRADGLAYETVVCYSLGSLLTDARSEENTAGMIAQIAVTYDPATRRIELGEVGVTPVYVARTKLGDETAYRVVPALDAQALEAIDDTERGAAARAAQRVLAVTGQQEGT